MLGIANNQYYRDISISIVDLRVLPLHAARRRSAHAGKARAYMSAAVATFGPEGDRPKPCYPVEE